MMPEANELLATIRRGRAAIDSLLEQSPSQGHRAKRMAEVLRSLWPSAPLAACALREEYQWQVMALDQTGSPRVDWADAVRKELTQRGTGGPGLDAARLASLTGQPLALEEIALRDSLLGILALAVPEDTMPELDAEVRALLGALSPYLGLRLGLEDLERERQALWEELAGQAGMARVGEVAGSMVHEVNNFLNVCQLHVAVLEMEVPESLRPDLKEITRQGAELTALIKHLQRYRQSQQPPLQAVDFNAAVRAAVATQDRQRGAGPAVHLQLAAGLLPVLGSIADLKRLSAFLLANAAAAGADALIVRTQRNAGWAALHLEDNGPGIPPDLLPRLFEPEVVCRPGTESLELAACKGLVRRLQGKIHGENRPEGGVVIVVELPIKSP
jgi:signal transduction histidine kinase